MHETTPLLQRVLFWLFIAWVVWLPLPIGSNRPLWVGIALAAGMAILALWLCGWIAGHLSAPRAVRRSRWPLAVMALFLAWQLGQMYLPGALASESVQNAYQQAGVQRHSLTADASESAAALRHSVLAATAFLLTLLFFCPSLLVPNHSNGVVSIAPTSFVPGSCCHHALSHQSLPRWFSCSLFSCCPIHAFCLLVAHPFPFLFLHQPLDLPVFPSLHLLGICHIQPLASVPCHCLLFPPFL